MLLHQDYSKICAHVLAQPMEALRLPELLLLPPHQRTPQDVAELSLRLKVTPFFARMHSSILASVASKILMMPAEKGVLLFMMRTSILAPVACMPLV